MMSLETDDAMAELIPLDSPARHLPRSDDMTADRERHLAAVLDSAHALIDQKFRAGQVQHGGNIWEKPGMLQHAIEEVADQTVYLFTLEGQMSALALALRSGTITAQDAAGALERMLRC
jgi:hypothetical protein